MATNEVKRKLTAIFSADVEGYSRLMGEDELATVETLTSYKQIMRKLIRQYRGRVVDSTGDNLLAEFASVVDAVQCAVEIQQILKAKNDELPENRRMLFRIGINLGDVIEEGDRLFGDGVNIAARVESLAEGGGISLSGTAYDQLGKKLPLGYKYLGEQTVKNIEKPVRVYSILTEAEAAGKVIGEKKPKPMPWRWAAVAAVIVILAAGAFAIWNSYFRPPPIEPASVEKMAYPLPENPSIAVLPFANLSEDPKQEYLADAITENIISVLSRVPKMFVVARNSTFTFKGKPVKVRRVAEEFGVQYVLEGSVQRSGDRIRITAQLIDAINAHHLWSERYDRELKNIYDLQDDITMEILRALRVKLTEGEGAAFRLKYEPNIDVYLKYLRAREYSRTGVNDDLIKARKMVEEIISSDPKFVYGYTRLAWIEYGEIWRGMSKSPKESRMRGIELAKKSIEIEDNPSAHIVLADIYKLERRYDEAIAEAKKSIEMVPNNADGYKILGDVLIYADRAQEAIPILKKAIRLNPLPEAGYFLSLGWASFQSEKYEEGIDAARAAVRIRPNQGLGHRLLAACYAMAGREEEARAEASEVLRLRPDFSISEQKAIIGPSIKDQNKAEKYYEALRKAGLPEYPPLPLPDKPSIAVLPFENISGDPTQEFIGDGLSENIINALSQFSEMFVIARNSTFTYKGKPVKVQQVAEELGVQYVLEGSVQKSGHKIRLTAQLIDALKGHHLWSEKYDRDMKDYFDLQDEITKKVITSLKVQLTEGEQARVYSSGTNKLEAFLKAIEADWLIKQSSKENVLKAQKLAEEAIAIDPEYAFAYKTLGSSHYITIQLAMSKNPRETLKKAVGYFRKAIKLDDSLAQAHASLAICLLYTKQHDTAFAEAKRALELEPNLPDVLVCYATTITFLGNPEEAIPYFKDALRLNPIPPAAYYRTYALALRDLGRHEEAIVQAKKAVAQEPDDLISVCVLVSSLSLGGHEEEAREGAKEILRLRPNFSVARYEKIAPHKDRAMAKRYCDALRKTGLPE